jgi:hypothetical protein
MKMSEAWAKRLAEALTPEDYKAFAQYISGFDEVDFRAAVLREAEDILPVPSMLAVPSLRKQQPLYVLRSAIRRSVSSYNEIISRYEDRLMPEGFFELARVIRQLAINAGLSKAG